MLQLMIDLHFEREGKGSPFVLITGYTANLGTWKSIRTQLAKHFDLILFDNRGAGRSEVPKKPWSLQTMADDVHALLEHLKIPKTHLLGHSMGGAIAQAFAHTYPDKVDKLILSNTFIKVHPAPVCNLVTALKMRKAGVKQELLIENHLPWIYSNTFLSNPKNIEMAIQMKLNDSYPISEAGQEKQLQAILDFDSHPWFHTLKAKTLVIHGEEDIICPFDAHLLAKKIPNATLKLFPKQAHFPHIEIPDAYASTLLHFLTD